MKKLTILNILIMCVLSVAGQITNPAPYCNYDFSSGTPVVSGGITNVSLGSINNTTNAGNTTSLYTYFNNLTPPALTIGNSYTMNVTFNSTGAGEPMYGAVYIDYDNDNNFSPAELIWSQGPTALPVSNPSGNSIIIPIFITIPASATPATTRMRVIRFEDNVPNSGLSGFISGYQVPPCNVGTGTYSHLGEVEDYDIQLLAGAVVPTTITTPATAVTMTDATLNGDVNMNNTGTGAISFDYGLTTAYGNSVAGTPNIATGNTLVSSSSVLAGLTPGTIYHYRVVVIDGNNVSHYGNDQTFVTVALPTPILNTLNATNITTNSGIIRGNANMNGVTGFGALELEYGLTTAYGNSLIGNPPSINGTSTVTFTANATGLTPNTTYHYRAKLTENGNVHYGPDSTFTTIPLPDPTITTSPATNVLENSAGLNGIVNAMNLGTGIIGFEYGLTTAYGNVIGGTPATITGNILTPYTRTLNGLSPSTTYHYRAFITINGQTHYGYDQSFTTRSQTLPNISTSAVTNLSNSGVQLNGFVNPEDFGTCVLSFEWGPTPALGNSISSTPNIVSGNQLVNCKAYLNTSLTPGSTYFYRLVADISGSFYAGTILSFTLDDVTAVREVNQGIKVYPNPTHSNLYIELEENIQSVSILDLLGRQLLLEKGSMLTKQTLQHIDLPSGMYILRVEGDKNTYIQKISIQ